MTVQRHACIAAVAAIVLAPFLFTRARNGAVLAARDDRAARDSRSSWSPGRRSSIGRSSPTSTKQGRLYVADSSGSNDKVEKQLAEKPHRIVRLEDTDGDGRFDKSVVFADRMMFPEGTMWLDGSLYVAAPPSIWKLTDTDGDGVADQREEWFQGKTLTGCANDLHGPYLGPDGWIYWTKGAFAEQTYERPGKPPLVTRAAHIFRRRPDGRGDRDRHDRRHGQPGRRRLHRRPASASSRRRSSSTPARAARRPGPRHLRRRLRQGPRRHRRAQADRRSDAGADASSGRRCRRA